MKTIDVFLSMTTGLECVRDEKPGVIVKVEFWELADGRIKLQAIAGRNLSKVAGHLIISREEFDARPLDAYDDIKEARWALNKCGWEIWAEADA